MAQSAAEALKSTGEKPKHRCPGCGKGVKPDDLICTKCGTNVRTGRRVGETAFTLSLRKVALVLLVGAPRIGSFAVGWGALRAASALSDLVGGVRSAQAGTVVRTPAATPPLADDPASLAGQIGWGRPSTGQMQQALW